MTTEISFFNCFRECFKYFGWNLTREEKISSVVSQKNDSDLKFYEITDSKTQVTARKIFLENFDSKQQRNLSIEDSTSIAQQIHIEMLKQQQSNLLLDFATKLDKKTLIAEMTCEYLLTLLENDILMILLAPIKDILESQFAFFIKMEPNTKLEGKNLEFHASLILLLLNFGNALQGKDQMNASLLEIVKQVALSIDHTNLFCPNKPTLEKLGDLLDKLLKTPKVLENKDAYALLESKLKTINSYKKTTPFLNLQPQDVEYYNYALRLVANDGTIHPYILNKLTYLLCIDLKVEHVKQQQDWEHSMQVLNTAITEYTDTKQKLVQFHKESIDRLEKKF